MIRREEKEKERGERPREREREGYRSPEDKW